MNLKKPPQLVAIRMLLFSYIPFSLLAWFGALNSSAPASQERLWGIFYFIAVYSCIAYAYFHVFNMSETARRVRILHEIDKAGALSAEHIIAVYGTTDILSVRLERLISLGEMKKVDGRYYLTGKILHLAASLVMLWRSILGFPPVTTEVKKGGTLPGSI